MIRERNTEESIYLSATMTEEQGMLVSDGESDCGVLEDYTTSMDLSGAAMSSLEEQQLSNMDRSIDHLQALLICENQGHYSPCQNYFQAIRSRQSPPKVRVSTSEEEHPSTTNTDTAFSSSAEETTTARLNESWRTQLCEWCFVSYLGSLWLYLEGMLGYKGGVWD